MVSIATFAEAWFAGANPVRQRRLAWTIFVLAWLTFITGGFWYVAGYPPNKIILKEGNWPWAHNVIMEIKEHAFFFLLMAASLLPFFVRETIRIDGTKLRPVVMTLTGLIIVIGVMVEAMGALIGLAIRASLQ